MNIQRGQVRIIGGQWRRHILHFPAVDVVRPTANRVRETLFNWLSPQLQGSRCIDLFAGTGALGFEALSRGAATVTLIEKNARLYHYLREQAEIMSPSCTQVYRADAIQWLMQTPERFDIIFLDPPFSQSLLPDILSVIEHSKLLSTRAVLSLEFSVKQSLELSDVWEIVKKKRIGKIMLMLIQKRRSTGRDQNHSIT